MVALPKDEETDSATVLAVYAALQAKNESWLPDKIGMSSVGSECDRQIWNTHHWVDEPEELPGPKLRIFATGHKHEDMIIADLKCAGIQVRERDPATGKQWEVIGLGGHLKGKLDGRCSGVPEAPVTEHVLEVKTHNDKSFKKLQKERVAKAKPEHHAQFQLYMHFYNLTRALYVSENKNDSTLYTERVNYDREFCERLLRRLEKIRDSAQPPSRLHDDPSSKAAFGCRWCKSRGNCHEGIAPKRSCRTCLDSTPINDGKWFCSFHNRDITYLEQKESCGAHLFIPALIAGTQIDADEEARSVTYEMSESGVEWVDAGNPAARGPFLPSTDNYWGA